jgi:hypothetical protein
MKEIQINNGGTALVDDEDFIRLSQFRWSKSGSNGNTYALASKKDPMTGSTSMHRMIVNPPKNLVVDHIDGNGLNNQRSNLRVVTPWQNACNKHSWTGGNIKCNNLCGDVCTAKNDSDCCKKSLTLKRKPTAYCHSVPVRTVECNKGECRLSMLCYKVPVKP